jgi:hypothetical protein
MIETITLKPSQLMDALAHCDKAKLRPFIVSPPGLGKSQIVAQYAAKRPFVDTRLSYASPIDLRGVPYREGEKCQFASPAEYPSKEGTVWLLDEYSCASKQVRNAALQLLLENKIGQYTCPKDTFIVLAGNGISDRANVERAGSAEVNRIVFVSLRPDLNDWVEWALPAGIDPRIVAFLNFRPGCLHDFDPSTFDGSKGFASPRSWEFTNRLLKGEATGAVRMALMTGLVGQGAALEFEAFLKVFDKLPDFDDVLANPTKAIVPKNDPAVMYAITAGLALHVTEKTIKNALVYLARIPKEFEVFAVRMALKSKSKLAYAQEVITWVSKNKDVLAG